MHPLRKRVSGMPGPIGTLTSPMTTITVYSTTWCPWCDRAKALLDARGIAYEDVNVETQPNFRQKLVELTGGYTVPQIVIDEQPIGGFRELRALDASGELASLIAA
jgi:glutaredoxin 3